MKSTVATAFTAVSLLALSSAAAAETMATAMTDLNIRSGPGPQFDVIGVIGAEQEASVEGCVAEGKWCKVSFDGTEGWSYSDYLSARFEGLEDPVIITERPVEAVPVVTYEVTETPQVSTTTTTTTTETADSESGGALAGGASGAIAGALIGGPIGAAIGGAAGAVAGATADAVVSPPEEVVTYVQTNKVEPVYLDGEVVVGAGLPETVEIRPIPDYEYNYVYVNRQPVLVDPASRQIVYVIR